MLLLPKAKSFPEVKTRSKRKNMGKEVKRNKGKKNNNFFFNTLFHLFLSTFLLFFFFQMDFGFTPQGSPSFCKETKAVDFLSLIAMIRHFSTPLTDCCCSDYKDRVQTQKLSEALEALIQSEKAI